MKKRQESVRTTLLSYQVVSQPILFNHLIIQMYAKKTNQETRN